MTRVQRLTAGAIGSAVAALLLGVLVGALGTVLHRSIPPWGIVVCLSLAFVEGLYAAGNAMGAFTGPGYPGPGVTIAAAMTFGYLAARHAAAQPMR